MLRVGLTGGVGSGKSAVADMLAALGARVSRSDEVGRAMMQPGQPVFEAIAAHFGPATLLPDGALDRAALARIAFEEGRVEELNALVHPAVIETQQRWMDEIAREDPEAVAVVESALIFETKHGERSGAEGELPWRTRFNRIAVVLAPEPLRRRRYIARAAGSDPPVGDEVAAKDFDRRAGAQWSDEQKAALADTVLLNDGALDALRAKVMAVFARWKQESADRASEAM